MSAYNFAVEIGMPEGLSESDQQLWLHKWRDGMLTEIKQLTSERDQLMCEGRGIWQLVQRFVAATGLTAESWDETYPELIERAIAWVKDTAFSYIGRTADNIPVHPDMVIWHPRLGSFAVVWNEGCNRFRCRHVHDEAPTPSVPYRTAWVEWAEISECYSTQAAAEAAGDQK